MEGIIVIAIIWFVFRILFRGMKAVNQSGQRNGPGERPRTPYRPPLTPTARPGGTGAPDWGDIMTMLGGAGTASQQPAMEGESIEAEGLSGSLAEPSMREGSSSMLESSDMMDGRYPIISQPSYEGAPLPGASSTAATAPLPVPETPAVPLRPAAQPGRYDPAAMRSAVVWAEILAKPKSLRRVAR